MSFTKLSCFFCLVLVLNVPLTLQYDVNIDSTTCTNSSIICVSSSTFVTCNRDNNEVSFSTTEYSCPTGYSCDDSSSTVCQLTTTTAEATTTQVTTTAATTTAATTTQATTTQATTTQATTTQATTTIVTTTPVETTTVAATTPVETTTVATTTPVETTTVAATTTPEQTTTPATTTVTVETTTIYGEPNCNSTGNYPGPTCSEYYECVAVWWWYSPSLQTCDTGLYFSKTNGTCVAAAESGCTE